MVSIYVLKLESNKFYIGKTNNDPQTRFEQHLKGKTLEWTKMYKPIEIIKIFEDCCDFDEDKYTLKYMHEHGIDNVRGGSFCEVNLPPENITTVKKMIRGATNSCFTCGSNDHFAKNCTKDLPRIIKSPNKRKRKREDDEEDEQESKKDDICHRCGRNNHCIESCYATYHRNGKKLKRLRVNE